MHFQPLEHGIQQRKKPWNNESAEKWWACGRHVRQKELAPSAKVRRTTQKKHPPARYKKSGKRK
jgi:hypothetical protein